MYEIEEVLRLLKISPPKVELNEQWQEEEKRTKETLLLRDTLSAGLNFVTRQLRRCVLLPRSHCLVRACARSHYHLRS